MATTLAPAPVLTPASVAGLTEAEAAERLSRRGWTSRRPSSRSYASIVRANVFTVFNLILAVAGAATLAFGEWQDALFLGVLVANAAIPDWRAALLWLGASAAAAAALVLLGAGLGRASALGLAAGLLFAGGDISAKLVVYGGTWLLAALALIVCYAHGTSVLQGSFQHGDALTGAGLATLATNVAPIAAGFVVFSEDLPLGLRGAFQLTAFAALVASAVLLARGALPEPSSTQSGLRSTLPAIEGMR